MIDQPGAEQRVPEGAELTGALGVPTATEIVELCMAEVSNCLAFYFVDQFEFVRLCSEECACLFLGDLVSFDRYVGFYRPAHPFLESR